MSCWLWKINPYFKLTSYPPQMSSWYVKLNLKHIPHAWIIKHFNWTQFHNPKIKVFYIPRIIHHLFGQVDRKRTQFTVLNWMDFLGRRSNLGLTKKKRAWREITADANASNSARLWGVANAKNPRFQICMFLTMNRVKDNLHVWRYREDLYIWKWHRTVPKTYKNRTSTIEYLWSLKHL